MNPWDKLLTDLKRPFDPNLVKWRVGATTKDKTKGIALAYIDARDVMKRLDETCQWDKTLTHFDNGFICEVTIKMDDGWHSRSDVGGYTKVSPEKGGASDAFKRAAANWGVGRYLYYLPNEWMPLKNIGSDKYPTYVLAKTPTLPKWATPEGYDETVIEKLAAQDSGIDADENYASSEIEPDKYNDQIAKAQTVETLMELFNAMNPKEQADYTDLLSARKKEIQEAQNEPAA